MESQTAHTFFYQKGSVNLTFRIKKGPRLVEEVTELTAVLAQANTEITAWLADYKKKNNLK